MDGDRAMQQGEIGESEGGPPAGHPVGHEGTRVDVTEREAWSVDGFAGLAVSLLLLGLGCWMTVAGIIDADAGEGGIGLIVGGAAIIVLGLLLAASLTIVAPGQTRVVQFFGRYVGTVRRTGLTWVVPLTTRRRVSVRVRNFETNELKVNDADGNPVEIAAIVVWQVADTAKADLRRRGLRGLRRGAVRVRLRHVATTHPYDDTTGRHLAARLHRHGLRTSSPTRSRSGSSSPGSRSSRSGSATWPTPRRSPRPCCSANRPVPWSPPAP